VGSLIIVVGYAGRFTSLRSALFKCFSSVVTAGQKSIRITRAGCEVGS
jgi:hypothetical protein